MVKEAPLDQWVKVVEEGFAVPQGNQVPKDLRVVVDYLVCGVPQDLKAHQELLVLLELQEFQECLEKKVHMVTLVQLD